MDHAQQYRHAVDALNRGDFASAFRLSFPLLPKVPGHGGVRFVAGLCALQLQRVGEAVQLLREATQLSPDRADYRAQYARALASARLFREATGEATLAVALAPTDPLTFDTLGVVFNQANDYRRAADMFREAVKLAPEVASFRFNHATALTFAGELDAAEAEYEACITRDPHYWRAHLALSQLRKQTAERNHMASLQSMLSQDGLAADARLYLNLAVAKELEDLGSYEQAFDHLVVGKRAGMEQRAYDPADDERLFDALIRVFDAPMPEVDAAPDEPVFVFGMPRSGTTLVERILSSHPLVTSAGELQNLSVAIKRLSGSRTRHLVDVDTVVRASTADLARLRGDYIASTRPLTGATPHFVDKLPHNFLFAGFIARAMPGARMVCVRRDPMDTCLSNFRQLFALSSPYYDYSFDPVTTARYYVLFDRLMAHWQRVLPGRILQVSYEDIVDAQRASTERLLAYCGLPWDERCLRFEENDAPVATASAVQVREPMFRTSIGRWKRYGDRLAPMREVLENAGIPIAGGG